MHSEERAETRDADRSRETAAYRAPSYATVNLACEISAYAPDSDSVPLF